MWDKESKSDIQLLSCYIGHDKAKDMLRLSLEAAKKRGEQLEHVLIVGPAESGKSTLAVALGNELRGNVVTRAGSSFKDESDLATCLLNISKGDVLIIEGIQQVKPALVETLAISLLDGSIEPTYESGWTTTNGRFCLESFTCIGVTESLSVVPRFLLNCFDIVVRLDEFTPDEVAQMIREKTRQYDMTIDNDAALHIAGRSNKSPRKAFRLLKRVRDYAQVNSTRNITENIVARVLLQLDVAERGAS